ncbi:hypothetical protein GCM10009118_24690 [Wandonia haliotis]|uniref:Uncharacterized protein n=1 Tax=Wandonia haliotis TaxID=574963 RepID=A0ABP3Y5R0_9FLAO
MIFRYSGSFKEIKKGQTSYFTHLSHLVTSSGETSNFLLEDLEQVAQLKMIEKHEISIKLEV